MVRVGVQILGLPALAQALSEECQGYLDAKNFSSVWDLQRHMANYGEGDSEYMMPCTEDFSMQNLYMPDPSPGIPGAMDTSDLSCRYGNIQMWGAGLVNTTRASEAAGSCCGVKPHFNWIVSTCEETQGAGQFCWDLPACAVSDSVQINYVAAYQYNGSHWVMMDDSTAGTIGAAGVSGTYANGNGWERVKSDFRWAGGDWTTKYAPWANGVDGPAGPRGLTPPGALWILSAENFYYGAFYMLSQLTLNLQGKGNPTRTDCWVWELDPVEGAGGWNPLGPTPGDLNQLYATSDAQSSGCMPLAYTARQSQANKPSFTQPEIFRSYCSAHPSEPGCSPWEQGHQTVWSGGSTSTHRFENLWQQPYVFAVVIDADGYWTYRWIPGSDNGTGWPGVKRHHADRVLQSHPKPVTNAAGLKTDVAGDVTEAVILQPSLPPAFACQRASIEVTTWQWGSDALGSMAEELGENGRGGSLAGAQNWWAHFAKTGQYQDYPISIMGVPSSELSQGSCSARDDWTCDCALPSNASSVSPAFV